MLRNLSPFLMILILIGCHGKGYRPAEEILDEGWARVEKEDSEQQEPLYCYKTLGTPDCYKTPDPRRAKELVSIYPLKKRAFRQNKATPKPHRLETATYVPTPQESVYQTKVEAFEDLREEALVAQKNYDATLLKRKKEALAELKKKQTKIIVDNKKPQIIEKQPKARRSMDRVISGITAGHPIHKQLPQLGKTPNGPPTSKELMAANTKAQKPLSIK